MTPQGESDYSVLLGNLRTVEQWVSDTTPVVEQLETHSQFMQRAVECMNMALYLLTGGVSLAPSDVAAARGYSKQRAIVMGHLVRIMKLYEGLLENVAADRGEFCAILGRLLLEAATRAEYLMKAKRKTFKNFVLISYRPEKEQLQDLRSKAKSRPLIPIEKRILSAIKARLGRDGITTKQLLAQKSWELDGKSFRQILAALGDEWSYAYGFGGMSHYVHGDWRDISQFHVHRKGRYYQPNLHYKCADPRYACPITHVCLDVLNRYLKWNRSDPGNFVRPIVARLMAINRAIDDAHERWINTR